MYEFYNIFEEIKMFGFLVGAVVVGYGAGVYFFRNEDGLNWKWPLTFFNLDNVR